jgi:hypothetical protein
VDSVTWVTESWIDSARNFIMWADRAGIGVGALVLIGVFHVRGLDESDAIRKRQAERYASAVAECDKPPLLVNPKLGDDELDAIFDEIRRMGCPPREPELVTEQDYLDMGKRLLLYMVLPFWLVLRIVDFVFGGPATRRSRLS